MKPNIFLTILSVAIFTVMLAGCGGQVTENPPAGPEATAPVTLTFSSDTSGDSLNLSANKDASGFADTRLDGGDIGGIGNEAIDIVCDLTFGHAVRTGNALTSTGIEVRDLNDPLVAACANASKCIECQNEWKTWDDVALAWVADPSHSHCVGTCTGVVPANAATELDELEVYSHFYGTVTSDMPSVDLAALLYQGWIENWPTLDFSDVLDDPGTYEAVVLDVTGDFTFSFLQDPFTTHGLASRDVIGLDTWTRGIDITALDSTPAAGVGSGKIHTQHLASMPFTGAASGAVDLSAGPLSVALTLCDDVNNCTAIVGHVMMGSLVLLDSAGEALANSEYLSGLQTANFDQTMNVSSVENAGSIIVNDTVTNTAHEATLSLAPYDAVDELSNDDFIIAVEDELALQKKDVVVVANGLVTNAGFIMNANFAATYGCAMGDTFESQATIPELVYDEGTGTYEGGCKASYELLNNSANPNQATIEAGNLDQFVGVSSGELHYSDANKIETLGAASAATLNMSQEVTNATDVTSFRISTNIENVAGIDAQNDSIGVTMNYAFVQLIEEIPTQQFTRQFCGVEALELDPIGAPGVFTQVCVGYTYYSNAGLPMILGGSYLANAKCSSADLQFRMTQIDELRDRTIQCEYLSASGAWVDLADDGNGVLYPNAIARDMNPVNAIALEDGTQDLVYSYSLNINSAELNVEDVAVDVLEVRAQNLDNKDVFPDAAFVPEGGGSPVRAE